MAATVATPGHLLHYNTLRHDLRIVDKPAALGDICHDSESGSLVMRADRKCFSRVMQTVTYQAAVLPAV